MAPAGKRTFWAATGGWIMDVQMFSFAIPAVMAAFGSAGSAAP
jgi:hypothetical protein